ncbi:MAG: phosphatidylserine synthase, partial [Lachnospiraceae bacterium]|nr:phosphatidylserine synthase [Lachnospiraceae bacterium]
MEEKRKLNGYYNYTVVLTYLGMLVGFTGIIYTTEGLYRQAVLCLMIAGVCDMFDGTIAATKQRDEQEKKFGIQID